MLKKPLDELDEYLLQEAHKVYVAIFNKYMSGQYTTAKQIRELIQQELKKYNSSVFDEIWKAIYAQMVIVVPMQGLVTKPQLSKILYKNAKKVERSTYNILKEYTKYYYSILDLTKELKKGSMTLNDVNINKLNVPKYVKKGLTKEIEKLKTDELKKVYFSYINAMENVKNLSKESLDKVLQDVVKARLHYYSYRVAHTESFRVASRVDAVEVLQRDDIELVKYRLSSGHKIEDECDAFARADFGWGAGIYPKELAPSLPLHPFCACRITPVFKKIKKKAGNFRGLETALNKMTPEQQKRVLKTQKNYREWKKGTDYITILNRNKDNKYKIKPIGEIYNVN